MGCEGQVSLIFESSTTDTSSGSTLSCIHESVAIATLKRSCRRPLRRSLARWITFGSVLFSGLDLWNREEHVEQHSSQEPGEGRAPPGICDEGDRWAGYGGGFFAHGSVGDPGDSRRRFKVVWSRLQIGSPKFFLMRHVEDLSIREICQRTNRSSDSVRSSLYRVKHMLVEGGGWIFPAQPIWLRARQGGAHEALSFSHCRCQPSGWTR